MSFTEQQSEVFFVPEIRCASCTSIIKKTLSSIPNLESCELNSAAKTLRISVKDKCLFVGVCEELKSKLSEIGFSLKPLKNDPSTLDREELNNIRSKMIDLGAAGAIFANVMLFAAANYAGEYYGIDAHMARYFNVWSAVLASLSMVYSGKSFFINAWNSARSRVLHIDLPIVFALLISWCVSIASLVRGLPGPVYFDSISGLIFLLLLGRFINLSIMRRVRQTTNINIAKITQSKGSFEVGEVFDIAPGSMVPIDGIIVSGKSDISESILTGESVPSTKTKGDYVFAGTMNLNGTLRVRAVASGRNTWVQKIRQIALDAVESRMPYQIIVARALPFFVFGTLCATMIAGTVWAFADSSRVIEVVCATLIVSCPCALALATPMTTAIATRQAWHRGLLVKDASVYERASGISAVLFDKTGTITKGFPEVIAGENISTTTAAITNKVCAASLHPFSRAIAEWTSEKSKIHNKIDITHQTEFPGLGIEAAGKVDGSNFALKLGKPDWAASELVFETEGSVVAFCLRLNQAEAQLGYFVLQDEIRAESLGVLDFLRAKGVQVFVASGDQQKAVAKVAKQLDLSSEQYRASLSPEQKLAWLHDIRGRFGPTMMVGDGVNDSAVLASADIGVAMHGSIDAALERAHCILAKNDLYMIPKLLDFGVYVSRTLGILLGVTVAYNLTAVGFAISGIVHPFIAALIMPASSLSVLGIASLRNGDQIWKQHNNRYAKEV